MFQRIFNLLEFSEAKNEYVGKQNAINYKAKINRPGVAGAVL